MSYPIFFQGQSLEELAEKLLLVWAKAELSSNLKAYEQFEGLA
jgi:hypothetical protein